MNISISIQDLYNKIRPQLLSSSGYPLGQIVAYPFSISNSKLKLLDEDNILKKNEYSDLYSIIGDYYTNLYKQNISTFSNIRLANDDEFMIPNLSGRYLVEKTSDQNYEFTPASYQSFKIVLSNELAKISVLSNNSNEYKSITENTWTVNTTSNPIKSIEQERIFDEKNLTNNPNYINIADKCVLFYMVVK